MMQPVIYDQFDHRLSQQLTIRRIQMWIFFVCKEFKFIYFFDSFELFFLLFICLDIHNIDYIQEPRSIVSFSTIIMPYT